MCKIDIALIAGLRPELVRQTLESFSANVFDNFDIGNVIVNIDPFGSEPSHIDVTRTTILEYFPSAVINSPDESNFCLAVKNNWLSTTADYIFHIEDDWRSIEPIAPSDVFPLLDDRTKILSLMNEEKNWNKRSKFDQMKKRPWYFPLKMDDRKRPKFTTSPSIWDGEFARRCAGLLDTDYDPEKQFYSGANPALQSFVAPYKNRYLTGRQSPNLIEDIGRQWREEHGIVKQVINSKSIWTKL